MLFNIRLQDKKSGPLPAAHKRLNARQLHCGVDSLFKDHFLVFLEPVTFIQTLVFILVGSITGYARAFYHHDASYKGKYLELPYIFELGALCQVIF
jgi:hypothetical protein